MRFPKGDPENPLSWDELTAKYTDLATAVWTDSRASQICEAVRVLEAASDLRNLTQEL